MALGAFYVGDRRIVLEDSHVDAPGTGEVRVAVAFTGICGTDLHILHGAMDSRVSTPAVLGHEMSGRIEAIGPDVTGWSVGDAVTVMPLAWCGTCPACRAGHTHICHHLNFIGIDSPGAMQRLWTVPAEILVRVPDPLPLMDAALAEPTAVAVHDVRRSRLTTGERVVVVGAGPVGLLIAVVARRVGGEVLVLEPNRHRRQTAADLGLSTMDPTGVDPVAAVEEWTTRAGADVVFEVSGSAAGVQTATDVLATRGRMVVVAIHPTPRPVNLHRVFWRELELIGVRVYQRADFEEAVRLLADGLIPTDRLISRVVPLDAAAEAFHLLEQGAAVKVLIDCGAPR